MVSPRYVALRKEIPSAKLKPEDGKKMGYTGNLRS